MGVPFHSSYGVPADRLAAVERAAARPLAPALLELLRQQNQALGPAPARAAQLARLAQPGSAIVATGQQVGLPGLAFAGVLAAFFAADGLLVLDPRHPVVARLAAPVVRTALTETERLEAVLVERGRALAAAGHPVPVQLRPGSPLAFVHE